eukprot:SAG31_NODE_2134_length_6367_cov_7.559190_4_plen_394_part_00
MTTTVARARPPSHAIKPRPPTLSLRAPAVRQPCAPAVPPPAPLLPATPAAFHPSSPPSAPFPPPFSLPPLRRRLLFPPALCPLFPSLSPLLLPPLPPLHLLLLLLRWLSPRCLRRFCSRFSAATSTASLAAAAVAFNFLAATASAAPSRSSPRSPPFPPFPATFPPLCRFCCRFLLRHSFPFFARCLPRFCCHFLRFCRRFPCCRLRPLSAAPLASRAAPPRPPPPLPLPPLPPLLLSPAPPPGSPRAASQRSRFLIHPFGWPRTLTRWRCLQVSPRSTKQQNKQKPERNRKKKRKKRKKEKKKGLAGGEGVAVAAVGSRCRSCCGVQVPKLLRGPGAGGSRVSSCGCQFSKHKKGRKKQKETRMLSSSIHTTPSCPISRFYSRFSGAPDSTF